MITVISLSKVFSRATILPNRILQQSQQLNWLVCKGLVRVCVSYSGDLVIFNVIFNY